jgi:hypothetical protein
MKMFLMLAAVVLVAGATGCKSAAKQTAYCRPACAPVSPCGGVVETYSSPGAYTVAPAGTMTTAPTLSAPPAGTVQSYPGPEAYTPAN